MRINDTKKAIKELCKKIFHDTTDLELGEDYEDVFKNLKQKYGSNLQGIIVIHSMPYSAFFSLDLS